MILTSSGLFDRIEFFRIDVTRKLDTESRAQNGQFFTPSPVATFMASMFSKRPEVLNIIDAGAGIGSLSAALVSKICEWEKKPEVLTIAAYEIEPILIEYLRSTLEECRIVCEQEGIQFGYEIIQKDFIASAVEILRERESFFGQQEKSFNCAILNPPYHKMSSESEDRLLLRSVGIETSNFYTAFLWLIVKLLEAGGEMVAITPRSFCNGSYFKVFRQDFLKTMAIQQVHVFDSRKEAFSEDDVLQENIIIHAIKDSKLRNKKVVISSSVGPADDGMTIKEVEYSQLVNPKDPDLFIHIISDELDYRINEQIHDFDTNLEQLGLTVSTGRVVDFRVRHLLRSKIEGEVIPLIYPGNFLQGFIEWPSKNIKKPHLLVAIQGVEELVVVAGVYVLVKRFSAKEEKRRIVAVIFDPQKVSVKRIGFENHLNYYHRNGGGLPFDLAKGLSAFLNSTLVDQYFRQFSGHTQVNASDLRKIPYPSEEKLLALGAKIRDTWPNQEELDQIVKEELSLMDSQNFDPIQAKKKIEEALNILRALKLPRMQLNDRSALTLLALLDIKADSLWKDASNPLRGITEMMDYFKEHFGVTYAPNTRETVRRQTVHQFVQVGLLLENPDDPERPVNSPHTRYQIEPTALKLVQTYGAKEWDKNLETYLNSVDTLKRLSAKEREMTLIPVKLPNGEEITLSGGGQNVLIKKIIEEFCPRFTPGGIVVYVGDAGDKMRGYELSYLKELGVEMDKHGKMPDVIIHFTQKNWLVLIEAVTSHGPIDIKRHNELKELFEGSKAGLVFVTAFETRKAMVKFLSEIAWETDVWVGEAPSHIIHFNGERFLGPYE